MKKPSYRAEFEAAEVEATEVLEREAWHRATEGREEAVWFNGKRVGTVRKPSDLLLIFLLKAKKPEIYRERLDSRFTANLNVQSAVKIVHEYVESPAHVDVTAVETLPSRQLLGPTELPTITEQKAGAASSNDRFDQRDTFTIISPVTKTSDN